jgi:hypothetical protein
LRWGRGPSHRHYRRDLSPPWDVPDQSACRARRTYAQIPRRARPRLQTAIGDIPPNCNFSRHRNVISGVTGSNALVRRRDLGLPEPGRRALSSERPSLFVGRASGALGWAHDFASASADGAVTRQSRPYWKEDGTLTIGYPSLKTKCSLFPRLDFFNTDGWRSRKVPESPQMGL